MRKESCGVGSCSAASFINIKNLFYIYMVYES